MGVVGTVSTCPVNVEVVTLCEVAGDACIVVPVASCLFKSELHGVASLEVAVEVHRFLRRRRGRRHTEPAANVSPDRIEGFGALKLIALP